MRLRNVKGSRETIAATDCVVHDPENYKGRWNELFGNDHPIHIEVGMGKGKFLMELARLNPEINYIGIEMYDSVILRAVEKTNDLELNNLKSNESDLGLAYRSLGHIMRDIEYVIYQIISKPMSNPPCSA